MRGRHRRFLAAALLLLASCSTKEEDTLVGSSFVDARRWAVPVVDETVVRIVQDTYFELAAKTGTQDDLLVGDRRKFRFESAIYFSSLPAKEDSLISARITATPWYADGAGSVRIDRPLERWTETSNLDTLGVETGADFLLGPGVDAPVPLEWVRSWIDSSAGNHGLLIRPVDGDSFFLRIPSREAKGEEGGAEEGAFRLHVEFVDDDTGLDSTLVSSPALDRFYAFKVDPASYVTENMEAGTIPIGVRETMSNQALFEFDLPESLRTVTVNQFELVLTVAGAELETEMALYAYTVLNDTLESDSIAVKNVIIGRGTVPPDAEPGDTTAIDLSGAARSWWAAGTWDRRILVRSSNDLARDRYAAFHASEGADTLAPRVRLLYTPLRPDGGTE